MDQTIIQEIADQLGIAVDNVGTFIETYLPQYAALKSMQMSVGIYFGIGVTLLFLLLTIIWIIIINKVKVRKNDYTDERVPMHNSYNYSEFSVWGLMALAGVFLVALIFTIVYSVIFVPQIIGWNEYPQAMLIDMVSSKL